MLRKLLNVSLALLFVLTFALSFALPVQADNNPTVKDDEVYWGDSEVYLSVSPHTLTASGWVELYYKTYKSSGTFDVVCGFAGDDGVELKEAQVYESYQDTAYRTIQTKKEIKVSDNKTASYLGYVDTVEPYNETYTDWNKPIAKSQTVKADYYGVSDWQVSPINKIVDAGEINKVRVWIDIPFKGTATVSGKYCIGIKPSNLSIAEAKAQNKLWVIDPWYNASWAYCKSVAVTNASADYQTKITVYYGSGEDTTNTVYLNSHCQADFDDIRLTGSDGTSLLDIWDEQTINSDHAIFWVQNDATPSTTCYIYYGNADATSVSNGAATFIVFDDFERGNDGDTIGGSWTETAAHVHISTAQDIGNVAGYFGTRSGMWVGAGTYPRATLSGVTASSAIAIRFNYYKEDAAFPQWYHGNGTTLGNFGMDASENYWAWDGASAIDTTLNCVKDTWGLHEVNTWNWSAKTMTAVLDGNTKTGIDISYASASYANVFNGVGTASTGKDSWIDNVIVRKFAATEPTWGSWGSETTNTPTVTTSAADNIGDTFATLHGDITNLNGGDNCTTRGFGWDIVSRATWDAYTYDWHEDGDYGVSSFSTSSQTFPEGTTIYFTAYATRPSGTGQGVELTFLTKPAAPTNVAASDGTYTDNVTVTWTKSTGATGYKVYEGSNLLDTLGDVDTYDDVAAPAPTITEGTADACDGCAYAHVVLSISGESANVGASRTYKVKAFNATGDSVDSATDTGYRGVGALTYEWFRSDADSDADYNSIAGEGGTTDPYNDTNGVLLPDGRWYYCELSADGVAASESTNHDRGFRVLGAPIGFTLTYVNDNQIDITWALGDGAATTVIRRRYGDYPSDNTSGDLIYYGSGTYYSDINVDLTGSQMPYYWAWSRDVDGVWETVGVGKEGNFMSLSFLWIGLIALALGLSAFGLIKRMPMFCTLGAFAWAIILVFTYYQTELEVQVYQAMQIFFLLCFLAMIASSYMVHRGNQPKEVPPEIISHTEHLRRVGAKYRDLRRGASAPPTYRDRNLER